MGGYLRTHNPDAVATEQRNFENAVSPAPPPKPPEVKRISNGAMRILGEMMAINPASHTPGLGVESVWIVTRLRDGRLAVGSFGRPLMTPDEVAEAIKEFQALPHDGSGRDTVGS
jgi:hypothetical protein